MTPPALAVLAALIAQTPGAAAPRYERPIAIAAPGPQRIAIDTTLLAGGAPFRVVSRGSTQQRRVAEDGLSDLRLFSADGHEVPYLLIYPPVREPQWIAAAVLPIAATEKTSGFEADLGSVQDVDGLDLRQYRRPFMKRFSLEASADREHWTQVIPEGTLFDLPERQLRQTDALFRAGAYRYLRVTWDDTHSERVPLPAAAFIRIAAADAPPPPLTAPIRFERRASEPGRSRYHLTLPGARLPITALLLDTGGTYLFRSAVVTEPRLAAWQAAPVTIGEGLLVRQSSGTTLRVPIQQPSQAELDVLVEDGSNPPLDLRAVTAEFAELPWIYVSAPGPLVARYGDVTLPPPSYDLEAARRTVRLDALPEAKWGAPSSQPQPASTSPIDMAALTGGPLDVSSFHYAREIAGGTSELVGLPLDAAVFAHSAGPAREFADVRIVDGSGRQIPRLTERRPEPLVIPLRIEPTTPAALEFQPSPTRASHRSFYRVALPYTVLPEARVVLATTAVVFQRHVAIGYERPADRGHRDPWFMTVGSVEWSGSQGASNTLTLPLNAAVPDAAPLMIVVDEGDNGALPITSVQLLLPSYRLRFVRPASTARLVYGSASIDMPRYDLALLAPTVLGAAVADVSMSPEAETKAAVEAQLISPRMFWVVLAVAVVALLGVLVALLRKTT